MVRRTALLILFLLLIIPSLKIYSEDNLVVPDEYNDLLDSIPDDIRELLPDEIFSSNSNEIEAGTKKLIDWNFIIEFVFDTIGLNIKEIIKAFATILSILMLCSLLNMFQHTIKNKALESAIRLITGLALITSIVKLSNAPITNSIQLLNNIKLFVNTISPTISVMYAMGGNISTALVHNYGLIVFLSIIENICVISLEIIVGVCLSLTFASSFLDEGNLIALCNSIKKVFSFFIGFIMLIFTTIISTQTLLSTKSENISTKAAKMIATQIIPLVGSTVGETLRTAGASIEYLRSNVGVIIIVIFILMILPTLISVSLYRIVFSISNSFADLLSCKREGRIILEISSILGYVLAIISICSISLLLLITIFTKCASPLS